LKEQISDLEDTLEQVRNKDMDLIATSSGENTSEKQKTLVNLNERIQRFLDEPTNYQKMVRLSKEEFETLVNEVEPAISKTTSMEHLENKKQFVHENTVQYPWFLLRYSGLLIIEFWS
jgi:hypothetical protein